MKKNNIEDESKLEDIKKFHDKQQESYLRMKDLLKDTDYPCD